MTIKIPSTVSLAKKAGKTVSGEEAVKEAVRCGKASLVILAEDAGRNTEKSIKNSCAYYDVRLVRLGTKEELGRAIGRSFNAVIAVCDRGFAESIETKIVANINGGEVL